MRLTHEYTYDLEGRFKRPVFTVLLFLLIVLVRLYVLQVLQGDFYRHFSTENSIKETKLPAARGIVYDRSGKILVDNVPRFQVVIIPQYVVDPAGMLNSLQSLLDLSKAELDEVWAKRLRQAKYQQLVVKADASLDEIARIRARKSPWHDSAEAFDLRGVEVRTTYQRTYPDGSAAAHVLGYVSEIDGDRLTKYQQEYPDRYKLGDQVGVSALEEEWDELIRGEEGFVQRAVNAIGREVEYIGITNRLKTKPARAGASLHLTIDAEMQSFAQELFAGRRGSAVVIDVNTGALLTLLSSPTYDLEKLTTEKAERYWRKVRAQQSKPLFNRAVQGAYPPASTYKIVTAIAGLSEELITPEERIDCKGSYRFGRRTFHCWNRRGHGASNLRDSIIHSCDIYYYVLGLRLGVDRLAKYANLLGFGSPTGIRLAGERSGLIPTKAWKKQRFGSNWLEGETLSIAVGQGYDLVTPLQNALMIAQVVNGGKSLTPHLVSSAFSEEAKRVYSFTNKETQQIYLDPEVLQQVSQALADVVSTPGGTAHRLSRYKVSMGGKTGTAQVVSLSSKCTSEKCRDHGWFVGFSPVKQAQIAVSVIVENGGFGSGSAAPIAGALMQKYHDISQAQMALTAKSKKISS